MAALYSYEGVCLMRGNGWFDQSGVYLPSLGTRRSFGNLPGNRQIAVNPLTEARSFRRSILLLFQRLG
jgi:hypothetical protein